MKVATLAGLTSVADVAAGFGATLVGLTSAGATAVVLAQPGAPPAGATAVDEVSAGCTTGGAGAPVGLTGKPVATSTGIVSVMVEVTGGWATVMTVVVKPLGSPLESTGQPDGAPVGPGTTVIVAVVVQVRWMKVVCSQSQLV